MTTAIASDNPPIPPILAPESSTDESSPPFIIPQTEAESTLNLTSPPKRKKNRVRQKLSHEVAITPCSGVHRYSIRDGLRRVEPYFWTYNTFAKGRWLDRPLLDIFESEMRDRPLEYYRDAIETGHIVVNAKTVPPSTLLKNGDVITHTLHRHEPPVTAADIGIVSETDDLLVIDKPAGVPVHPAGRYHFNSVMEILRVRYNNAFNPRPCNRLDRLTSGIMFVGKTAQGTDAFTTQLMTHTIRKEYIARVIGEFPEETVVCGQPILQISPKLGLNAVRANGKEARTIFKRVAYYPPRSSRPEAAAAAATAISNPSTPADSLPWLTKPGHSIVRCFPLTGRTHQIRVHLQFLGHPIANDPIYANQRVFGPQLWSGHSSFDADEAVMARLERMGKDELADAVAYYDELVDAYHARRAERLTGHECELCSAPLYSDPGDHELGIYLHARRYACAEGQWAFETALPLWAMPPAGIDGPTNVGPENDVDDEMFIMEREKLEASALPRAKSGGMVGRPANGVIDNGEKISQTHTKENS